MSEATTQPLPPWLLEHVQKARRVDQAFAALPHHSAEILRSVEALIDVLELAAPEDRPHVPFSAREARGAVETLRRATANAEQRAEAWLKEAARHGHSPEPPETIAA